MKWTGEKYQRHKRIQLWKGNSLHSRSVLPEALIPFSGNLVFPSVQDYFSWIPHIRGVPSQERDVFLSCNEAFRHNPQEADKRRLPMPLTLTRFHRSSMLPPPKLCWFRLNLEFPGWGWLH